MENQISDQYSKICINCMEERGAGHLCANCGYDETNYALHPLHLKPRRILKKQYLIGRVLGQGGFGITYMGLDVNLYKKVAIKEYLPSSLAGREISKSTVIPFKGDQEAFFTDGLKSFIAEARSVAKFSHNPHIVHVINYFEENNTGYIVMDYIEGETLAAYLKNHQGKLSVEDALAILFPIMDALQEVHAHGIYHRDISSQNIYLVKNTTPILIDFGAARHVVGEQSRSLDVVLKPGYSPLEQYSSKGRIGSWTDVYACGAMLYLMITGILPPPATNRVYMDELQQPSGIEGLDVSAQLNNAILYSLAVRIEDRYKTIREFKEALKRNPANEYRELLESYLAARVLSLKDRLFLDSFLGEHQITSDVAQKLEHEVRKACKLPPLDWEAEYIDTMQAACNDHDGKIPADTLRQLKETYVKTPRITEETADKVFNMVAKPPKSTAMETVGTAPAGNKRTYTVGAITLAAIIAIGLTLFIFHGMTPKSTTTTPPTGRYGYINVWSTPDAEIFINGTSYGTTPQSKLKVPAGKITIKLVNKKLDIEKEYSQSVEPEERAAPEEKAGPPVKN
ncbi:MAG: protein kinase [Nitrospirae bacterium]|nr:protein kinase [Nitrospirota bacterium]